MKRNRNKNYRRNYNSSSEESGQGFTIAVIFIAIVSALVIMSFIGIFGGIAVIIAGLLMMYFSKDSKWHSYGVFVLVMGVIMFFLGIGLFVFFNNTGLGKTLYDSNIQLIKIGTDIYNITGSIPKVR